MPTTAIAHLRARATLHTTLGAYFMRTIMRTASEAVTGGGVDVPFSSASSALTQGSSKS